MSVARAGSFSRAARRLNLAQPALSRQIKKLEDELGVQLLKRHGRGVEITGSGALLLSEAEEMIERLSRTLELLRGAKQVFTGQVTIGLAPTSGLLIAPEIYRAFNARWLQAKLTMREDVSSLLEEWLINRRIDIAVLHNPTVLENIELRRILHEHMVLAFAPSGDLAGRAGIGFADLTSIPLILPTLPHSNRRLPERPALQYDLRLNVAIEVDCIPLIKSMVKRGYGAIVQTFAGVEIDVACGELAVQPIDRLPLVSTICFGIAEEAHASWQTLEVARLLETCIGELVTNGN